jgi:hypothetical protein
MRKNKKPSIWIPIVLILLVIFIVIISPEEKEIAAGIKPVYVHVALTWTAITLFFAAAVLAIINIFKKSSNFSKLLQNVFGVALLFHFLGLIMSIISSYVNWGGVRLGEAGYQITIYVLIFGGISLLIMKLIENNQLKSVVGLIPAAIFLITRTSSHIGLHPDDPVLNAPASIKYTFLGLFCLMLLLSIWLAVYRYLKNQEN